MKDIEHGSELDQYEKSVAIKQNIRQWVILRATQKELLGRLETLIRDRYFEGQTFSEAYARGPKELMKLGKANLRTMNDLMQKQNEGLRAANYTADLILNQQKLGVEDFDQALGMADAAQEIMWESCQKLLTVIHRYQG